MTNQRFMDKITGHRRDTAGMRVYYGVLGSVTGIVCNLVLFAIKFAMGMSVPSVAILADAFNNLSDMASSVIGLLGTKTAAKPADRKHPFGYGRAEYIAAMIISIAIINVGISFFREGFSKILHPEEMDVNAVVLTLLVLTVGLKVWMFFFDRGLARKIQSDVLQATASDSLFDALTTSVTIAAMLCYRLAGINIDGAASLVVSVIVIIAGIQIAKGTISPLIGQEMDPGKEKEITELVRKDPTILGTHDLLIHSYGPSSSIATIHIEVPSTLTLEEAHAIADSAERRVVQETGIILVVHVDPADVGDARVVQIRGQLTRILAILDSELSFHDLQITFGEKENLIRFDLEVPYRYKPKEEQKVQHQVTALMQELDPANHCDITIDRGVLEEKVNMSVDAGR